MEVLHGASTLPTPRIFSLTVARSRMRPLIPPASLTVALVIYVGPGAGFPAARANLLRDLGGSSTEATNSTCKHEDKFDKCPLRYTALAARSWQNSSPKMWENKWVRRNLQRYDPGVRYVGVTLLATFPTRRGFRDCQTAVLLFHFLSVDPRGQPSGSFSSV